MLYDNLLVLSVLTYFLNRGILGARSHIEFSASSDVIGVVWSGFATVKARRSMFFIGLSKNLSSPLAIDSEAEGRIS